MVSTRQLQIAAAAQNSITKSRSDTASIELRQGASNPSSLAVNSRLSGYEVPASAAAPSGIWFIRVEQSCSRP